MSFLMRMKQFKYIIICILLLYPVILRGQIPFFDSIDPTQPDNTSVTNEANSLGFSTQDFGFQGPWSLATVYSKTYGTMLHGQLVQGFDVYNAIALLFELGRSQRRINGTYGYVIDDFQRIKVSAEYLQQNINFDFDSGNLEKWIGQGAYGVTYNYLISQGFFHDVDVNAYYSKAGSRDLESKIYHGADGNIYENFRRIAGGTDKSLSFGAHFQPTQSNMLGLALSYDKINYAMQYGSNINDQSGFGVTLSLEQLLSSNLKLKVAASNRKPTNSYEAALNWLVPMSPGNRLEIGLIGSHLDSGSGLNSDDRFGINVGYSINDGFKGLTEGYRLGGVSSIDDDIANWTATPAVYMSRVLAIKDQKSELVTAPTMGTIERIYKIGQEVFDDISSSIQIGCSRLQEVYDDGTLAHYGLGIFLQGDGKQVVIKGKAPLEPTPDFVDIPITLVNIGGIYSQGAKLKLKIESNPVLISIDPNSIPASSVLLNLQAGLYTVTVKGTGFRCEDSIYPQVTLGSLAPLSPVACNDQATPNVLQLSVAPPGTEPGQVDVTVTNKDGGSTTGKGFFAFAAKPTFDSLSKTSGSIKGGDKIIVSGSGFKIGSLNLVKGVYFGGDDISGTAATITNVDADNIMILSPAVAAIGVVNVWVVTAGGALKAGPKQFTYYDNPADLIINPTDGSTKGGTSVYITRTAGGDFTQDAQVSFGDTVSWINPETILGQMLIVKTPARSKSQTNTPVYVKMRGEIIKVKNSFDFIGPPTLQSFSPTTISKFGCDANGNVITLDITGKGFSWSSGDDVQVELASGSTTKVYAVDHDKGSSTILHVPMGKSTAPDYAPILPPGSINITVTNADTDRQQAAYSKAIEFVSPDLAAPSNVTPTLGSTNGNYELKITGQKFRTITGDFTDVTVKIGSFPGEYHPVAGKGSQSSLTIKLPFQYFTPGTYNIYVKNPGDSTFSLSPVDFTFEDEVPKITSVVPNEGSIHGNYDVVVHGSNFSPQWQNIAVKFGDNGVIPKSHNFDDPNNEQLTVTVPERTTTGAVNVTVTNPEATQLHGTLVDGFTYIAAPIMVIQSITPDHVLPGENDVIVNCTNVDTDPGHTAFVYFGDADHVLQASHEGGDNFKVHISSTPSHLFHDYGIVQAKVVVKSSGSDEVSDYKPFSFYTPTSVITSVTPTSAPFNKINPIHVVGENFKITGAQPDGIYVKFRDSSVFPAINYAIPPNEIINVTATTFDINLQYLDWGNGKGYPLPPYGKALDLVVGHNAPSDEGAKSSAFTLDNEPLPTITSVKNFFTDAYPGAGWAQTNVIGNHGGETLVIAGTNFVCDGTTKPTIKINDIEISLAQDDLCTPEKITIQSIPSLGTYVGYANVIVINPLGAASSAAQLGIHNNPINIVKIMVPNAGPSGMMVYYRLNSLAPSYYYLCFGHSLQADKNQYAHVPVVPDLLIYTVIVPVMSIYDDPNDALPVHLVDPGYGIESFEDSPVYFYYPHE
jgi:hypothetical protein